MVGTGHAQRPVGVPTAKDSFTPCLPSTRMPRSRLKGDFPGRLIPTDRCAFEPVSPLISLSSPSDTINYLEAQAKT